MRDECLMLVDYTTSQQPDTPPDFQYGASFSLDSGAATQLLVLEGSSTAGAGASVSVLAGTAAGMLSSVQMELPGLDGATLSDVVVRPRASASYHTCVASTLLVFSAQL